MANIAEGLGGALSGAATGSSIGGPIGGVAGSLLGGIAGLFGGKKKRKKMSTFDKNQRQLNELQHQAVLGQGPLSDLYSYDAQKANEVFDKTIANPAYQKFEEYLAPSVTGQFRSQGLQNSSYVGDALSKLARDIQSGLDAQRSQYMYGEQKDAQNARRNAINNLQGQTTFDYYQPANNFNLNNILSSIKPEQVDQLNGFFNSLRSGGR